MVNLHNKETVLVEMYEQLTLWIINDIVTRIIKSQELTNTDVYRIYKLQELGIHRNELIKKIKTLSKLTTKQINRIFKQSAIEDIQFTNKIIINNKQLLVSTYMKDIINSFAISTNNEFYNLNDRIITQSTNTFSKAIDKAYFSVVSGIKSQSQAISETIDDLSEKGIQLNTNNGRKESIESAVRRYIHTGVNKCVADINLRRTKELGWNHVLVSSHLGARHIDNPKPEYLSHDIWQGRVYTLYD